MIGLSVALLIFIMKKVPIIIPAAAKGKTRINIFQSALRR